MDFQNDMHRHSSPVCSGLSFRDKLTPELSVSEKTRRPSSAPLRSLSSGENCHVDLTPDFGKPYVAPEELDIADGICPSSSKTRAVTPLPAIEETTEEESLLYDAADSFYESLSPPSTASTPFSSPPRSMTKAHGIRRISSKPTLTSISEEFVGKNNEVPRQDRQNDPDKITKQERGDAIASKFEMTDLSPKAKEPLNTKNTSKSPEPFQMSNKTPSIPVNAAGEGVRDEKEINVNAHDFEANNNALQAKEVPLLGDPSPGDDQAPEANYVQSPAGASGPVDETPSTSEALEEIGIFLPPVNNGTGQSNTLGGNSGTFHESDDDQIRPSLSGVMPASSPTFRSSCFINRENTEDGASGAHLSALDSDWLENPRQNVNDGSGNLVSDFSPTIGQEASDVSEPGVSLDVQGSTNNLIPQAAEESDVTLSDAHAMSVTNHEQVLQTSSANCSYIETKEECISDDPKPTFTTSRPKGSGSDSVVAEVSNSSIDMTTPRESYSDHTACSTSSEKQDRDIKEKESVKTREKEGSSSKQRGRDRERSKRKKEREERLTPPGKQNDLKNAIGDVQSTGNIDISKRDQISNKNKNKPVIQMDGKMPENDDERNQHEDSQTIVRQTSDSGTFIRATDSGDVQENYKSTMTCGLEFQTATTREENAIERQEQMLWEQMSPDTSPPESENKPLESGEEKCEIMKSISSSRFGKRTQLNRQKISLVINNRSYAGSEASTNLEESPLRELSSECTKGEKLSETKQPVGQILNHNIAGNQEVETLQNDGRVNDIHLSLNNLARDPTVISSLELYKKVEDDESNDLESWMPHQSVHVPVIAVGNASFNHQITNQTDNSFRNIPLDTAPSPSLHQASTDSGINSETFGDSEPNVESGITVQEVECTTENIEKRTTPEKWTLVISSAKDKELSLDQDENAPNCSEDRKEIVEISLEASPSHSNHDTALSMLTDTEQLPANGQLKIQTGNNVTESGMPQEQTSKIIAGTTGVTGETRDIPTGFSAAERVKKELEEAMQETLTEQNVIHGQVNAPLNPVNEYVPLAESPASDHQSDKLSTRSEPALHTSDDHSDVPSQRSELSPPYDDLSHPFSEDNTNTTESFNHWIGAPILPTELHHDGNARLAPVRGEDLCRLRVKRKPSFMNIAEAESEDIKMPDEIKHGDSVPTNPRGACNEKQQSYPNVEDLEVQQPTAMLSKSGCGECIVGSVVNIQEINENQEPIVVSKDAHIEELALKLSTKINRDQKSNYTRDDDKNNETCQFELSNETIDPNHITAASHENNLISSKTSDVRVILDEVTGELVEKSPNENVEETNAECFQNPSRDTIQTHFSNTKEESQNTISIESDQRPNSCSLNIEAQVHVHMNNPFAGVEVSDTAKGNFNSEGRTQTKSHDIINEEDISLHLPTPPCVPPCDHELHEIQGGQQEAFENFERKVAQSFHQEMVQKGNNIHFSRAIDAPATAMEDNLRLIDEMFSSFETNRPNTVDELNHFNNISFSDTSKLVNKESKGHEEINEDVKQKVPGRSKDGGRRVKRSKPKPSYFDEGKKLEVKAKELTKTRSLDECRLLQHADHVDGQVASEQHLQIQGHDDLVGARRIKIMDVKMFPKDMPCIYKQDTCYPSRRNSVVRETFQLPRVTASQPLPVNQKERSDRKMSFWKKFIGMFRPSKKVDNPTRYSLIQKGMEHSNNETILATGDKVCRSKFTAKKPFGETDALVENVKLSSVQHAAPGTIMNVHPKGTPGITVWDRNKTPKKSVRLRPKSQVKNKQFQRIRSFRVIRHSVERMSQKLPAVKRHNVSNKNYLRMQGFSTTPEKTSTETTLDVVDCVGRRGEPQESTVSADSDAQMENRRRELFIPESTKKTDVEDKSKRKKRGSGSRRGSHEKDTLLEQTYRCHDVDNITPKAPRIFGNERKRTLLHSSNTKPGEIKPVTVENAHPARSYRSLDDHHKGRGKICYSEDPHSQRCSSPPRFKCQMM